MRPAETSTRSPFYAVLLKASNCFLTQWVPDTTPTDPHFPHDFENEMNLSIGTRGPYPFRYSLGIKVYSGYRTLPLTLHDPRQ